MNDLSDTRIHQGDEWSDQPGGVHGREEVQAKLSPTTSFDSLSASGKGAYGPSAGVAVPEADVAAHCDGTAVRSWIPNPRPAAMRSGLAIPRTAHGEDVSGGGIQSDGLDGDTGVRTWMFPEVSQAQHSAVGDPGVPGLARRPPVVALSGCCGFGGVCGSSPGPPDDGGYRTRQGDGWSGQPGDVQDLSLTVTSVVSDRIQQGDEWLDQPRGVHGLGPPPFAMRPEATPFVPASQMTCDDGCGGGDASSFINKIGALCFMLGSREKKQDRRSEMYPDKAWRFIEPSHAELSESFPDDFIFIAGPQGSVAKTTKTIMNEDEAQHAVVVAAGTGVEVMDVTRLPPGHSIVSTVDRTGEFLGRFAILARVSPPLQTDPCVIKHEVPCVASWCSRHPGQRKADRYRNQDDSPTHPAPRAPRRFHMKRGSKL